MAIERLEDGVRRIVAPNPSALTHQGTCTYVLGEGAVAVLDPGPEIVAHREALLAGLNRHETVAAILVSHAHLDHSEGAAALAAATGAPIYGFGPPDAGRSAVMAQLAAAGMAGGGEGVDARFRPDRLLPDGACVTVGDAQITALHTPGHFCNHLCFRMGDAIFTGDVVMGWASTLISPPDGDLGDYFQSLARLQTEAARIFYPGHGSPVTAPSSRLADLLAHRHTRTEQILAALAKGPATPASLAEAIYTDTPASLRAAAQRNVFAHLVHLTTQGHIHPTPTLSPHAAFTLT